MKTQIGLTQTNTIAVSNTLAAILADENILYLKTINAHWNVEGANFYEKKMFFLKHRLSN